jgi:hypothetical protein
MSKKGLAIHPEEEYKDSMLTAGEMTPPGWHR